MYICELITELTGREWTDEIFVPILKFKSFQEHIRQITLK